MTAETCIFSFCFTWRFRGIYILACVCALAVTQSSWYCYTTLGGDGMDSVKRIVLMLRLTL